MKYIVASLLFIGISGFSQTVYSDYVVTTGSPSTPSDLPTSPVAVSSGNLVYKAESEIVIKVSGTNEYRITPSGTYSFEAIIAPVVFAELRDKLDASYVITSNKILKFKVDELYQTGQNLNFKIYDYKRTEVIVNTPLLIDRLGSVCFDLNLSGTTAAVVSSQDERNYYILEVKNSKGDLKLLRFKMI